MQQRRAAADGADAGYPRRPDRLRRRAEAHAASLGDRVVFTGMVEGNGTDTRTVIEWFDLGGSLPLADNTSVASGNAQATNGSVASGDAIADNGAGGAYVVADGDIDADK